jgi:hypothetical protein
LQLRDLATLVLCAVLSLFNAAASAQSARTIAGLYESDQPVADQGQRALAVAARQGLAEVMARVSGQANAAEQPGLAADIAKAADFVERFSYRSDLEGLRVQLQFASEAVNEALLQVGLPVWVASRPVAMVFLGLDQADGRYLVDAASDPEAFAALHAAFAQRGVPLQLPLGDLDDLRAFAVEDAWRLDTALALTAAQRYRIDEVLVARVFRTGEGGFIGDWQYRFPDDRITASVNARSLEDLANQAAELVADSMVARYALTAQAGSDEAIVLQVTGIGAYADYAAVLQLLESVEITERVALRQLRGDTAFFRVYTRAEASQFAALLRLDGRLRALPVAPGGGATLNYQWQR